MTPAAWQALRRTAARVTRRVDEAEDLVQEALLAAVSAGRTDLDSIAGQRWLRGVIRNQATLAARTAARRRRRDTRWQAQSDTAPDATGESLQVAETVAGLPASLRIVALLALTGHSRREIAYILELSDTALRQRLSELRRRLAAAGVTMPAGTPGLNLNLSYGRIRDALLPALIRHGGHFASHDPDGHLFIVRRGRRPEAHKRQGGGNKGQSSPQKGST
jgi:RNA polymerase sigma factor (sigma-70 family)